MKSFKEILATLPPVDKIARLEMYNEDSHAPFAVIENEPGKQGSLAVYYKLAIDFGGITPKAAMRGLELFAEHTQCAKDNPGAHPNIDRLLQVIDRNLYLSVKTVPKNK